MNWDKWLSRFAIESLFNSLPIKMRWKVSNLLDGLWLAKNCYTSLDLIDIIKETLKSFNWLKLLNLSAKSFPNPGWVWRPFKLSYKLSTDDWIMFKTYWIPEFVILRPLKSSLIFLYDWNWDAGKIFLRSSYPKPLMDNETSNVLTP